MDFTYIFWFIFIFIFILPLIKNKWLHWSRIKLIKKIEEERNSRVITLIHRQEIFSIIGIPFTRYINIEDSEEILRAIRLTPDDRAIDIILHTPGGLVLAAEQIAMAIKKHPSSVRVIVPHYAMSGGTLIALAADEIVIDKNAVLGPVDPQIGKYPAVSILKTTSIKTKDELDDETLILADIAGKAVVQLKNFLYLLLDEQMEQKKIEKIVNYISTGKFTHDFPLTIKVLDQLNIKYNTDLSEEIYQLMKLYPQPGRGRPSVYYVS